MTLPGISKEELMALSDRFVLYVKMPYDFYKYIERSEKNDEIGRKLTDELFRIYGDCVFANDGAWNDGGKLNNYINNLKNICKI